MAYEVLMPQLGLTMEEGTVSSWIKHEGDEVKVGDVILEITTDNGQDLLLPIHPDLVADFDMRQRTLTLNLPEGLLELN